MRVYKREHPFHKWNKNRKTKALTSDQKKCKYFGGWLKSIADFLHGWHITRIMQALSSFLLFIALITYYEEREHRKLDRIAAEEERKQRILTQALAKEEREERKLARIASEWSVLGSGSQRKLLALKHLYDNNEDLSGIKFSGLSISGVSFTNAKLIMSDFSRSNFSQSNFSLSDMYRTNFSNTYFSHVNLSKANMREANFEGTYFQGVNLSSSNLSFSNFKKSTISSSDFTGALLGGVDFSHANLSRVNFSHAALYDLNSPVNFTGANVYSANFDSAYLIEAFGLTCDMLTTTKNWETSYRDDRLLCGSSIPITRDHYCNKRGWEKGDPLRCSRSY